MAIKIVKYFFDKWNDKDEQKTGLSNLLWMINITQTTKDDKIWSNNTHHTYESQTKWEKVEVLISELTIVPLEKNIPFTYLFFKLILI